METVFCDMSVDLSSCKRARWRLKTENRKTESSTTKGIWYLCHSVKGYLTCVMFTQVALF